MVQNVAVKTTLDVAPGRCRPIIEEPRVDESGRQLAPHHPVSQGAAGAGRENYRQLPYDSTRIKIYFILCA